MMKNGNKKKLDGNSFLLAVTIEMCIRDRL